VLLFFSYLYSVCVLLGTLTRSTIAALLLTMLAWVGFWLVDYVDRTVASFPMMMKMQHDQMENQIRRLDRQIEAMEPEDASRKALESRRETLVTQRDAMISPASLETAQKVIWVVKSFVPKTRDTITLLDRVLFHDKELQQMSKQGDNEEDVPPVETAPGPMTRRGPRVMNEEYQTAQIELDRRHSVWWIVGTSLMFEGAMVGLAAWIFCRRDY